MLGAPFTCVKEIADRDACRMGSLPSRERLVGSLGWSARGKKDRVITIEIAEGRRNQRLTDSCKEGQSRMSKGVCPGIYSHSKSRHFEV